MAGLLLGLFPGLRMLVGEGKTAGLFFIGLGLLALIAFVWLAAGLSSRARELVELSIAPRFVLVEAALALGAAIMFELLRLASSSGERVRGPGPARVLAASLVPAALVVAFGPRWMALYPELLEPLWLAALGVALVSVPAAAASVGDAFHLGARAAGRLARFSAAFVGIAALGVAAGALVERGALLALARSLSALGFVRVPELLAWVREALG